MNGRQWFRAMTSIPISSQNTDAGQAFPAGFPLPVGLDSPVKVWERPLVQLFAVFLLLGLFAWWTFQTVSLPPVLRDLFEEDSAIATAAIPPTEEERFQQELSRLPAPPENHAPEVAALLQRLRSLPPPPYLLQVALQRDASTPAGQEPLPWNEAELQALSIVQTSFREAWLPFLSGPAPDWENFPDSIALFRFQGDFLSTDWQFFADLPIPTPPRPQQSEPLQDPEFTLAYFRQIRTLGSLKFGVDTDTVSVANKVMKFLETRVIRDDFPAFTLVAVRENLPPPPSLEDLRVGLEADRALFLRAAQFLESLPSGTSAAAGITRWVDKKAPVAWGLNESGRFQLASDLATDLNRKASELAGLRQKTFLSGPAWRQWLSGDPGSGLSPLLVGGLGGFRAFEQARSDDLVAKGALDVRILLQIEGVDAARKVPDPLLRGAFFQLEETEDRLTTFCSYTPPGDDEPARIRLPDSLREAFNPAAGKTSPDAQGR